MAVNFIGKVLPGGKIIGIKQSVWNTRETKTRLTLINYYNYQKIINELIDFGDISNLGIFVKPSLFSPHQYGGCHRWNIGVSVWSRYEPTLPIVEAKTYDTIDDLPGDHHAFLYFPNEKWYMINLPVNPRKIIKIRDFNGFDSNTYYGNSKVPKISEAKEIPTMPVVSFEDLLGA